MRPLLAAAVLIALVTACSRRDAARGDSLPESAAASGAHSDTVVTVTPMLTLSSSAFENGGAIPAAYTCDGANRSPEVRWSVAPAKTAAYALIVEDPDAPGGTFIHWVLYDVPASTTSLPEGLPKTGILPQLGGARQGRTSFGAVGYGGPCPPRGAAHHYHFRLFALDAPLGLADGATRDQVVAAMRGHEVGQGELVGTYARAR